MPVTPFRFGPKATVTSFSATSTGAHTATATPTVIKQIILCNTDSTARTVSVGIGTTSTSSDVAAQRIISTLSLAANETVTYSTNIYLATNDIIYAVSSTAAVTITINGYVET